MKTLNFGKNADAFAQCLAALQYNGVKFTTEFSPEDCYIIYIQP